MRIRIPVCVQVFPPPFQYSFEEDNTLWYRSYSVPEYVTVKADCALTPKGTGVQAPFNHPPSSTADARAPWLPHPRTSSRLVQPCHPKKKISIVQRKTVTPSLWGEPLEGYCDFHCWERSNPVETLLSSDDMIRESSAKPSFREPNTAKKDAARTTAGNGIGSSAESTNAEGKGNGSGRCRASSPPPVEASRHKIFTGLGPCSTAN